MQWALNDLQALWILTAASTRELKALMANSQGLASLLAARSCRATGACGRTINQVHMGVMLMQMALSMASSAAL
jgi:hypothetical protein